MGFDFSFSLTPNTGDKKEELTKDDRKKLNDEKTVKVKRRGVIRQHSRRVASELALEQELPWHFKPGEEYHCISFGDVDSLTYLRAVVKQQHISWCMISSWCMAITDLEEIKSWIEKGYIDRVDFYVGEIFPGSYGDVYDYLRFNCIVPGARVCVFRNHSKIMAGYGEKFDFAIESSANMNTNPRTEQSSIFLDTELVDFYKDYFDGIQSFEAGYDNWKPYKRAGDSP